MAKFVDKLNTEWQVEFDLGILEEIKADTGIDLDKITGNKAEREEFGEFLIGDHGRKLAEVLWVMCRDQASKANIEPKDFYRRFNAATIEAATQAFLDAFISFSPRQVIGRTIRAHLPRLMEKTDRVIEKEVNRTIQNFLESDSPSSNGDTPSPASQESGIQGG